MGNARFPVQYTDRFARAMLRTYMFASDLQAGHYLRVLVDEGSGNLDLWWTGEIDAENDIVGRIGRVQAVIARDVVPATKGWVIDWRSYARPPAWVLKDPGNVFSQAGNPGRFTLSEDALYELHPELFAKRKMFLFRRLGLDDPDGREEAIEEIARHLQSGDSQPALILARKPPLVAAYSDELDAVVLLRFPEAFVAEQHWKIGDRLVSVNGYYPGDKPPKDIKLGPSYFGNWINFWPMIADFLSEDRNRLRSAKSEIEVELWERCEQLGREAIAARKKPRDGRPWFSVWPVDHRNLCIPEELRDYQMK